MSDVKPDGSTVPQPGTEGSNPAEGQGAPAAEQQSNFLEALSEDQKSYLKGIGVESLDADAFARIVDSSIKQKSSVSDKSRELEELKARLASQGQSVDTTPVVDPPAAPAPEQPPVSTPEPSTQGQGRGVTENDLFDLSTMINREFPELVGEAADGKLFAELRQLGFFGVEGINKRAVYDHLTAKHNLAKEIKELREFKEQYSQPDPSANPSYDPANPISNSGKKDSEWARGMVLASINGTQVDQKDLAEARQILQGAL